jgi:hypothetical protein
MGSEMNHYPGQFETGNFHYKNDDHIQRYWES